MGMANTIADLRQQIHDDLRRQNPEWVLPNGESPKCDAYEALLIELLARGPSIHYCLTFGFKGLQAREAQDLDLAAWPNKSWSYTRSPWFARAWGLKPGFIRHTQIPSRY